MSKTLKLYANIKDGSFEFISPEYASRSFNALKDGTYVFLIEKYYNKRSLPQNAYYWGVVVPMVKDGLKYIGYNEVKTNDQAHEILKHLFLKKKIVNEQNADVIEIAGSTAELKTVEFNEFLEEVWQWASTYLNITIPAPNEQMALL